MYYHYLYDVRQENQIVSDIMKAINGEFSAVACYEQIARMSPTQEARDQILEIRQDEVRHLRVFSEIYTSLTGRQPTPQITEPCPMNFRAAVLAAFKDEQETTDFYLDIAEKTTDSYIKEQFKRAAADEQNHAVWFLYFLTQNR